MSKWFFVLISFLFLACPLKSSGMVEHIRVGVYDNLPMVSFDRGGRGTGLFPELLEHIAPQEGWTLEYVAGTWAECLERLDRGKLDVLVSIAYTDERALL